MKFGMILIMSLALCSACASGANLPRTPRPPEGAGPGGTDFGHWRRDAEGSVDSMFRSFIAKKYGPDDAARARVELEKDGFECRDGNRPEAQPVPELDCTREYYVNDEIHAWTVAFWRDRKEPEAHYSRIFRRDPLRNYDSSKRN